MTFAERVRQLLEDQLDALRQHGNRYREQRDHLNGDDAKKYAADYRQEMIASERSKAIEGIRAQRERMVQSRQQILDDIARTRAQHQPTGAEALAARMEAADARARVRELLQRNPLANVLDRAVANNDRTTLEALREEVSWIDMTAGTLGDAISKELGLADDDQPVPAELVQRRIDRALLPLLPRALADAVESEIRLAEHWPVAEVYANAAELHIEQRDGMDLATALEAKFLGPPIDTTAASDDEGAAA